MQGPHIGTSRWLNFCFPWGPCPWGNQEGFNCAITFEVGLYAIATTNLFDAFAWSMGLGYDYTTLFSDFVGGELGACSALVVGIITTLIGGLGKPSLHPV